MISGLDKDLITPPTRHLDAVLAKFAPADQALIKAAVQDEMSALRTENERFRTEERVRAELIGGRPSKATRKGQRSRLTIEISGATRMQLDRQAKLSGRRASREAEILIEECLLYRQMAEQTRSTVEEMFKGNIAVALTKLGYSAVRTLEGKLWAEPGFPGLERWLPWREGELEALTAKREALDRARDANQDRPSDPDKGDQK